MSDPRSRITDLRSRPSSEQLVDLHIYVVPPDIWREKHHDVLNTDVNETISAGFIRVHPESKLFTLREDIEKQLGIDLSPKEYVFMKCVGRSLTRVKAKQEYQLKVKTFLPPLAYLPEVYLLEVSPDERLVYGLSSGDGSSRAQTRTSLRHGDSPRHHGNRNRYADDDPGRYNNREILNVENERIRNGTYINRPGSVRPGAGNFSHKRPPLDSQRALLKSPSSQQTAFTYKSASITSRDLASNKHGSIPTILLPPSEEDTEPSQLRLNSHRSEDPNLDLSQSRNLRPSNTETHNADSTAKSRQDTSSSALPPISNQSRSERLKSRNTSHSNERSQAISATPRPDEKRPLSATPPNSSDKSRRSYQSRPRQGDQSARTYDVPENANSGKDYHSRVRDEQDGRHREDDRQKNREYEEARRRQREAERRRQEEELRRWEDERRALQQQLEDDEEDQKRFADMERRQLLADEEIRQLADEARRLEDEERQRFEEEEAQRKRDEAEDFERLQEIRRQQEAEAVRQQEEDEALSRQQEEDRRRIEEERLRLQNDDLMKQVSEADEELNRLSSPLSLRMASPDREMTEEERKRKRKQKDKLQAELEKAREQRRATERQREELVRKAKQLQTKTQNRRNHARDVWKKRYFEEKKKTFPFDDQCNRLRHELDQIHRKLMNTLEGPKDAKGAKIKTNSPSEKNNFKIQATRLHHEIEDLKRRVENSKMKLTAEMKLRNQAETELRALRAELTQKKINLTLSRTQQMATLSTNNDLAYMTPRPMVSPRS